MTGQRRFWLLGPGIVVLFLAARAMLSPGSQMCGPVFVHGDRRGDCVALTFDDGPSEPYTGQVLDILQARGVKATFFLVGENALRFPDSVRREAALGMEIGNHSMTHPNMILRRPSSVFWEVAQTESILETLTGIRPRWFRPPHGFRDPRLFQQTRRLDLPVAGWSNMPKDWTTPGMDVIVQRVLNQLKPGDIILLHDGENAMAGGDRSQTVRALPYILDGIAARGLKPVTLSELARKGGLGLRDYRRMEAYSDH